MRDLDWIIKANEKAYKASLKETRTMDQIVTAILRLQRKREVVGRDTAEGKLITAQIEGLFWAMHPKFLDDVWLLA